MKKVGFLIAILVFVTMTPIIIFNVNNYKTIETVQRTLTTKPIGESEIITLLNEPDSIEAVYADDVLLTITTQYTVDGDEVTIKANVTDVDCCVRIEYTYTLDVDDGLNSIIIILPLLLVSGFVISLVKIKGGF